VADVLELLPGTGAGFALAGLRHYGGASGAQRFLEALLTLTLNLTRTRALPPTLTVTLALTLIPNLALIRTLTPSLTLSLTLTRFLEALLEDTLPPPLAALPRDLAELPPTAAPAAGNPSPNPQLIPTPTPNLTFSNLLT